MRGRAKLIVRSLALTLLVTAIGATAAAQVSRELSYQGLLTTGSGTPIADGVYRLTFRLWDDSVSGSVQWSESEQGVQVRQGSFSVLLGRSTSLDNFSFNRQLYMEVQVDSGPPGPTY